MKAFRYHRPTSPGEASKSDADAATVLKAGGIDLLDRMKERVDEPDRVVGLLDLPGDRMRSIGPRPDGALRIGALVTLAQLARGPRIRQWNPALADAAASAASPQIRNRATLGGNLAQHTRCGYYRHRSFPCLKRGDESCPVLVDGAVQDTAAIFGNRPCASAHPSSLAPVLAAGAATVRVVSAARKEPVSISARAFYRLPERGRAGDTVLEPGDVIFAVWLPEPSEGVAMAFEEIRQKALFDWALVSAAVRVVQPKVAGRAAVTRASVYLGSVAPVPWRAEAAEAALVGKPLGPKSIAAAAEAAAQGATPLPGNAHKVDLVKVAVRRALEGALGRL
jgi:xanthine dehydrogenase YagS FAD-binding subunit